MKRKNAFTLIELLAVIVVLAIIALIATPIVMNTIKRSKKGAAERSADNYIKQVETVVAIERLEGNILEGTYIINDKGNLTGNGLTKPLEIEMNGNKPTSGKIKITNGSVDQTSSSMTIGDYTVSYNSTKKTYEAMDKGSTSSTKVVYRWSTDTIKIGDTINLSDTSKFTKDASTLGKSYYLKHVLDKDNKGTESYVCSIYNGKEYCLTAYGVEYGYAENEADYTGNVLILKKIEDAKIEGESCSFGANHSYCGVGSVSLHAYSKGYVEAFVKGGYCSVHVGGSSACGCL